VEQRGREVHSRSPDIDVGFRQRQREDQHKQEEESQQHGQLVTKQAQEWQQHDHLQRHLEEKLQENDYPIDARIDTRDEVCSDLVKGKKMILNEMEENSGDDRSLHVFDSPSISQLSNASSESRRWRTIPIVPMPLDGRQGDSMRDVPVGPRKPKENPRSQPSASLTVCEFNSARYTKESRFSARSDASLQSTLSSSISEVGNRKPSRTLKIWPKPSSDRSFPAGSIMSVDRETPKRRLKVRNNEIEPMSVC